MEKKPSLLKSSAIFSLMTFVSRILGLVRDMVIANYFSVAYTDAFFAALRIPNTFRRFFAEGGFTNAFVPVLSETKTQNPQELNKLINYVFGCLALILMLVTIFGIAMSSVFLLGFKNSGGEFLLANSMLKITFPYVIFISLSAFIASILNVHQRFALPAFVPALLNVSLIVFAMFFRNLFDPPALALAWAVLVGGVMQFAIQIPALYKLNIKLVPKVNFAYRGVKKIIKLIIPTLIGSSVGQINILLNTFLASTLATGSITWLYYSDRLTEFPIALIGVALGTVILPRLSLLKASADDVVFKKTLADTLKIGFIIGSASATGLICLAFPLIASLFLHGKFSLHDTFMASYSLQISGFATLAFIMIKVLAPAYYSRQDTKTPVKIGLFCIAVNVICSLLLYKEFGYLGLAFSSALAAFLNMGLLLIVLIKTDHIAISIKSVIFVTKVLFINLIMALLLKVVYGYITLHTVWQDFSHWWQIIYLIILIILGGFSYIMLLFAFKESPITYLKK